MAIKRRIWVINAKFQWSLVAYTVAISLASTLFTAWISRQNGRLSPQFLLLILAGFNLVIVILAMWVSHRLAGPIYRLQRVLREGAQGAPLPKVYFRRGDCFPELNEAYNDFVEAHAGKDKQKGFTVVELMVVTGIISILAALSVATLISPRANYDFKAQVSQVEDIVLTARNAAFTRGECAILTLVDAQNLDLKTYQMSAPCTGPLPPSYDLHQTVGPLTSAALAGFSPAGGGTPLNALTFLPKGGTTAGAPVTLTVTSTGASGIKTILVYPAIGQVRVQ